jgi:hypothetical protein
MIFNKIPGSRTIFRFVFSFLINIDRLVFYLYKNKQYTPFIKRILIELI